MPHEVRRSPFVGLFNVAEDTLAGPSVSLPPAPSTDVEADCLIGAAADGDNGSESCKTQCVS